MMDSIDRQLINALQAPMPICARPLQPVADQLGISETAVAERIGALLEAGVLTRYGPMFDAVALGGGLSLCAMAVDPGDLDVVTELVNEFDEVAHNYLREHDYNLWFVVATETPEAIDEVLDRIEAASGYRVLNLPKLDEYYVGLRLELSA